MVRFLVLSAFLLAGPAFAADQTSTPPADQRPPLVSADSEKLICRTEDVTGSNIPERHCHSKAEWAALQRQHDAELRSVRNERGWANNGH